MPDCPKVDDLRFDPKHPAGPMEGYVVSEEEAAAFAFILEGCGKMAQNFNGVDLGITLKRINSARPVDDITSLQPSETFLTPVDDPNNVLNDLDTFVKIQVLMNYIAQKMVRDFNKLMSLGPDAARAKVERELKLAADRSKHLARNVTHSDDESACRCGGCVEKRRKEFQGSSADAIERFANERAKRGADTDKPSKRQGLVIDGEEISPDDFEDVMRSMKEALERAMRNDENPN